MTDQKHTKNIDLMQTMNGDTWAKEFVKTFIEYELEIDVDLMRAWFCSAIMVGHDHAANSRQTLIDALRRERDELREALDKIVQAQNGKGSFITSMIEAEKLITKTKGAV